jgi:hypothetical protein
LDASSVQTAREASRLIVWMIRAHPTENRMPRQAVLVPPFTCFAQPDVLFGAGEWTATGIDLMPGAGAIGCGGAAGESGCGRAARGRVSDGCTGTRLRRAVSQELPWTCPCYPAVVAWTGNTCQPRCARRCRLGSVRR